LKPKRFKTKKNEKDAFIDRWCHCFGAGRKIFRNQLDGGRQESLDASVEKVGSHLG
jgi:hypothetical protein